MAPFTATFASAALELSAILAARQTTNEPGDKSPALFAEQGRYAYTPSFAAAVAFLVLFGILTITNIWLFFRHRSWFWWSMNLAVLMEFVGYIARAISIKNLDKKNIFIVQVVLLLVAPAVYAAACYQAFGRIVLWIVPPQYQTAKHLWLPSRYITPLFVGFDVFAFLIQVVGGAISASADTPSKQTKGKNIILVGLGIQMVTFGFFVLASIRFSFFLRSTLKSVRVPTERNWRLFLRIINIASVLILVRTVARFVEFVTGVDGYLTEHEWFFYVFDSMLMVIVSVLFVIFHPGYFLPYLGIRRKQKAFSKHADGGFAERYAGGSAMVAVPREDMEFSRG